MRTFSKLAVLASLLFLAGAASASEQIKLKNGTVLRGRATAYDAGKKLLSFRADDGKEASYSLDQLDQRSVYMVSASAVAKDNAQAQLQVANYARDIGLYAHAARHYAYAEKADRALQAEIDRERGVGRGLAAKQCLKNAREALARNDRKEAKEWVATLLEKLSDQPEADAAVALLEEHYARDNEARDDELEREQSALLEKDLKQGKQRYDRMIARTKDGLTSKNSSKARNLWEDGLDDGKFVLKELDRLAKEYRDDEKVQAGVARYRELTRDQMVELHLHLASSYTVHSSYKDALKETNAALALHPNHAQALAARARIEQASSEGLGLDWF